MRILALYTAGGTPSVAFCSPGAEGVRLLERVPAVEGLAPAARELLAEMAVEVRDLDGVAIAGGPGSFTGLRVGASLALGLARSAGLDLFVVGTLDAWAAAALTELPAAERCHVALDARRGEVYLGAFSAAAQPGRDRRGGRRSETRAPHPREGRDLRLPVRAFEPCAAAPAEALGRLGPGDAVVGDARPLLLREGLDPSTPGFESPLQPLALWIGRVAVADPASVARPLEGIELDYLRQPQAVVARAAARQGRPTVTRHER